MELHLIWAQDLQGAIGKYGALPWHLPSELRQFRRRTLGYPVIMGWKTWASLGMRPLPHRTNIVVSRQHADAVDKLAARVVPNLDAALDVARAEKAFVIGGSQLYAAALPRAQHLWVTQVETVVSDPDAWAPRIPDTFRLSESEPWETDTTAGLRWRVEHWERWTA
jgi:dihydrofolate reductase